MLRAACVVRTLGASGALRIRFEPTKPSPPAIRQNDGSEHGPRRRAHRVTIWRQGSRTTSARLARSARAAAGARRVHSSEPKGVQASGSYSFVHFSAWLYTFSGSSLRESSCVTSIVNRGTGDVHTRDARGSNRVSSPRAHGDLQWPFRCEI